MRSGHGSPRSSESCAAATDRTSPGDYEKFDALGFTIVGSTPAEFAELIKRETARWPKVIKELGIIAFHFARSASISLPAGVFGGRLPV